MFGVTAASDLQTALERHLAWWGLRHIASDERYDAWQREALTPEQRARLTQLLEARRRSQSVADDVAFYDASADPAVLPVLYSQRYPFYLAVGPAMGDRFGAARRILHLGCGPGILTTFYAARHPDRRFLGLDRSRACIETARQRAASLSLANLEFVCADLSTWAPGAPVDLILSAQALFQAEQDPGVPSRSWRTFERPPDQERQRAFEQRTGLGERLDRLPGLLTANGRVVLFEKTGHLARRVPFQRALAARGFSLLEPPVPLPYTLGEEVVDADLLYTLGRGAAGSRSDSRPRWPETPLITLRHEVSLCHGEAAVHSRARLPDRAIIASWPRASGAGGDRVIELGRAAGTFGYLYLAGGASRPLLVVCSLRASASLQALFQRLSTPGADSAAVLTEVLGPAVMHQVEEDPAQAPLYENHMPGAQAAWEALPGRTAERQAEASEADGRQVHLELGTSGTLVFVYCANTLDQRQLVVMDQPRRLLLEAYYAELLEANRSVLEAPP